MTRQVINNGESGSVVRSKINGNTNELYRAALGAAALRLKPETEDIFLVFTGQSNMEGLNDIVSSTMPLNSEVYDWQAPSGSSSFSWVVADPARVFDGNNGSAVKVGMRGNDQGNIPWSCANAVQKATGRRVRMLIVTKTATVSSEWNPGGVVYNMLQTQCAAAMAAASLTKIDVLCWLQGESDKAAGAPGFAYGETAATILKTHSVTGGWSTLNHTHIIVCGLGDDWGPWNGPEQAVKNLGANTSYVSTFGRAEDGVHFLGDDSNYIGLDVAQAILRGPEGTPHKKNDVYQAFLSGSSVGTAPFTIESGFIGNGQMLVYARNAGNTKFVSALVTYWYQGTGRLGSAVIQTAGESGFTYTVSDFVGLFGSLNIAGTAGETWYWTVCQTKAPSVTAP